MPKKILDPPNVLKCLKCNWRRDFDWKAETDDLPINCPECSNTARVRCGANKRKRRGRCLTFVTPGKRCGKHGGNSRKGLDSGTFREGTTSRYVPRRYQETYRRRLHDPMAQRQQAHQLAMLAELEDEAAKRLDSTESGEAWDRLETLGESLIRQLRAIDRSYDDGEVTQAKDQTARLLRFLHDDLVPVIRDGAGEEAARRELVKLYRDRARIMRVQQQGEATVPVEVLATLQARFVALMTKYTEDQHTLRRLVAELREDMIPGWEQMPELSGEVVTIDVGRR